MPTSREYLEKADECERLASEAKTEVDRLACLDLARNWLEAAVCQDAMTPDQIAEVENFGALKQKPESPRGKARNRLWQRLLRAFH